MPVEVLKNAFVSLSAKDLSDHVRQVTLEYEVETEDDSAMGDDTRSVIGGLFNWTLEVEFNQDFDASEVDDTLFPLVGTDFLVALRRDAAAKDATNPEFGGRGLLVSYPPIGGAVGGIHTTTARIVPAKGTAGGHTLTRSTS